SPPRQPIIIPPDRIETGTWIAASIASNSPLAIKDCDASGLDSVIKAYQQMGATIQIHNQGKEISVQPASKYYPLELDTAPYPGFPTDMQAQIMANLCYATGRSRVRENIFENRFMHVAELQRMGAKISVRGNQATIKGPCALQGAPIMATDIRASVSLVVAALSAKGVTKISRIYHLDRGYQRLDQKLLNLGVNIRRVTE
ncbi:MAG: UDP-N-acetylglucosamine 1-carboxyvinyltransferase, partial [Deltaproteobacteria bacterium]|nr:UDP-N-acetylglucosamine 1-carboxyvinyltransferase [Deltaproteobacteria bacterium]